MPGTRAHLIISGRVQGVNFRSATQRQAETRGVTGWVRNTPSGQVEAVLEGEEEDVRSLVEWCYRGPSSARVERVELRWESYTGEFEDFDILGSYW